MNSSNTPTLQQQTDAEPLLCPFCQQEVVPADSSESDDPDAIKICEHVVLQHLWGYDPEKIDPLIKKWWDSESEKRSILEDNDESEETIYRECPYIEFLFERITDEAGPMPQFVASFGFCQNMNHKDD